MTLRFLGRVPSEFKAEVVRLRPKHRAVSEVHQPETEGYQKGQPGLPSLGAKPCEELVGKVVADGLAS